MRCERSGPFILLPRSPHPMSTWHEWEPSVNLNWERLGSRPWFIFQFIISFKLGKQKQARQSSQGSVVSISDLPEDVKNLILSHLPIRDAVRTSILSKQWRHNWVSIPDLVFDKDCFIKGASKTEHANVVDQVLLGHVGPIRTFSCTPYVPRSSDIYRWIPFLSRNGIKNLLLAGNILADKYDVPSSIFYCQELCHLELSRCMLKVPPTSKGFQNLLVLNLFLCFHFTRWYCTSDFKMPSFRDAKTA